MGSNSRLSPAMERMLLRLAKGPVEHAALSHNESATMDALASRGLIVGHHEFVWPCHHWEWHLQLAGHTVVRLLRSRERAVRKAYSRGAHALPLYFD